MHSVSLMQNRKAIIWKISSRVRICKLFCCTVRNFTLIYHLTYILECILLLLKSNEISEGTITVRAHWKTDIKPTLKTSIPTETHLIGQKMYSLVQKLGI